MTTNKCEHVYGVDIYDDENFGLTHDPIHVSYGAEFTFCPYCGVRLDEPEEGEED